MHRETLIETLLNTLEVERYMRAPLLLTLVDELSATPGFEEAAQAARQIIAGLAGPESSAQGAFTSRIRALHDLVKKLTGQPGSERGISAAREALSRALPHAAA